MWWLESECEPFNVAAGPFCDPVFRLDSGLCCVEDFLNRERIEDNPRLTKKWYKGGIDCVFSRLSRERRFVAIILPVNTDGSYLPLKLLRIIFEKLTLPWGHFPTLVNEAI
jgi:hypothetical protein